MSDSTKPELRKSAKRIRGLVSEPVDKSHLIASAMIASRLFREAKSVCCYVGVRSEVDTAKLLQTTLQHQKELVVPWCDGPVLRLSKVESLSDLAPRTMGIPEPSHLIRADDARHRSVNECDLIVVPGLAFTRSGDRLGYGAGYYDRLLAGCSTPKIAIAFGAQIFDELPTEPTDIKMNAIVTESEWIACKNG